MYFEIYIDTLFLLQFFLNFLLLCLVNKRLYHTASLKRILAGAILGAVGAVIPLLLPIKLIYSTVVSFLVSVICMSVFTFRAFQRKQFFMVMEKMFIMTLLLGGILLFLLRILPKTHETYWGIIGVLAIASFSYAAVCGLVKTEENGENVCRVTLLEKTQKIQLEALLDTGNSLIEPISKAPVSIVDEKTLQALFGDALPELYRPIPYHSVGKSKGILKGYQLEQMNIELKGARKECYKCYVAVSQELMSDKSNYKMILNPRILESKERGFRE